MASINNNMELKFIHITKTGGMSIAEVGRMYNIAWGQFHEEYGWWHGFFPLKPQLLKDKYDWFTVVRNPYHRVISGFYCNWGGPAHKNVSVDEFNGLIKLYINERYTIFGFGNHWSEQHLYIDTNTPIHLLKYENLKQDFANLVKLYNLNLELNVRINVGNKIYSEYDLQQPTLDLIHKVYQKDFEKFGYDMCLKA